MKPLTDLLTSTDPELVEFAKTFEAVSFYTDISSVRLNSLVLGHLARALDEKLHQLKIEDEDGFHIGYEYSITLLVRTSEVKFHCFVPFIRENNKP